MELTDELYEMGKNSSSICTIVNEDYVLLKKSMPCTDEELPSYLENMKKAKEAGINLSIVENFRMIPGTTSTFSVGSYTTGVFLEERAKGTSLDTNNLIINHREEYDFSALAIKYLSYAKEYVDEIERRANAPQTAYDKLYSDMLLLTNYGLEIDPKPLNFFYDNNTGFNIIDVIPTKGKVEESFDYYPDYLITAIYSYGPPLLMSESKSVTFLPQDLYDRLKNAMTIINEKMISALKKHQVSAEKIKEAVERRKGLMTLKSEIVAYEDIEEYIAGAYMEDKKIAEEKAKEQKEPSGIRFGGW